MAKRFLQYYENTAQIVWNQFMEATWNYVTNITKKNQEEMVCVVPLPLQPLLPLLVSAVSRVGGIHTFCPLSRAQGIRENPEYMSKQAASSVPLGGTQHSLGKNLLLLSPCKYHLLAFRDPGSLSSPSQQIFNNSEPLKWAFRRGWGAVALALNGGPLLPPPTSYGKYGDPPSSCTRMRRSPSTRCTLAPGYACLRTPGSRTRL